MYTLDLKAFAAALALVCAAATGLTLAAAAAGDDAASSSGTVESGLAQLESAMPENPAAAEAPEMLLFQEVPTVVTASRMEERMTDAPASVTVITREQILNSGAISIPDLLRMAPGVDVMQQTGANWDVSVRGFVHILCSKVLVLIDGRTAYNDFYANVNWYELPVVLEDIERIEVIRGPLSSLWGASALGGVINIITRSAAQSQDTLATAQYGSRGTLRGTVVHAAQLPGSRAYYKVTAAREEVGQWTPFSPYAQSSVVDNRKAGEVTKATAAVEWADSRGASWALSGGRSDGGMVFLFAGTGWHSLWEETAGHLMVDYRRQDLEIRGYWNHMRLSIADAPLAAAYSRPVIVYSDLYDIEALNSQKVGRHGVLYGANFRRQEMGQSGYRFFVGPRHQNLWAAYAQDASRVSDSTNLVVNGRYDHHPLAGGRFSGRAAVMRSLSANRTLRLSAASAFRSPDFAESYAEMWYWGLFGNPDLKHEGITSYDIEYRLRLTPRTNASLAAYYSSIENLIHVEQFAGPPSYQQFSNLGNAQARGVEFEVNHALSPTLTAFANYTYQWLNGDWKIMRDRPDVILASPRHKANLGFTLADPDRRLNASLLLNYRDQATIGDAGPYVGLRIPGFGSGPYLLVNGYVGWRGPQGPEIGLSFFNLGNYRHQEYAQGDYIGRRIMGSVRWEF